MTAPHRSGARSPKAPLDGVLNVLKPPGMTSHDVVAFARRQFGQSRIGHGGTLDPGAAGVLPLSLGRATRLSSVVQQLPKKYRVEMTLGVSTDTYDQYGTTTEITSDVAIPAGELERACARFVGTHHQVPPMTSARRHRGKRLYELAREGRDVEREARPVTIHRLDIVRILTDDTQPGLLTFGTRVHMDVTCSAGTYIRTLCHDIGRHLGCGAHMSFLIRTQVGPFSIDEAITLEDLTALIDERRGLEALLSPDAALVHLPAVTLSQEAGHRFSMGQRVVWSGPIPEGAERPFGEMEWAPSAEPEQLIRVHGPRGQLLGLARLETEETPRMWIRPHRVLLPQGGADQDSSAEERDR